MHKFFPWSLFKLKVNGAVFCGFDAVGWVAGMASGL